MRKFKTILILLPLVATTLVINGGTKVKCSTEQVETSRFIGKTAANGFPDLVSFTNYINQ